MNHLKPYYIFESDNSKLDLMDAMRNSSAGKDLVALGISYRVDRTGKLVIEGIRGKTYIQQQSDGSFKHWVYATGREYGVGIFSTLDECIRNCWREVLTDSGNFTDLRPKGMKIKEYKEKVLSDIHKLEGRSLEKSDLQFEILKILKNDPNWDPILTLKGILDRPDLKETFEFLGLRKITTGYDKIFEWTSYLILGKNSPIAKAFGSDSEDAVEIHIKTFPEEKFEIEPTHIANYMIFNIGGDVSEIKNYSDKIIRSIASQLPDERHSKNFTDPINGTIWNVASEIIKLSIQNVDMKEDKISEIIADHINDISLALKLNSPFKERVLKIKGFNDEDIKNLEISNDFGLF